jgi:hypothetical protein
MAILMDYSLPKNPVRPIPKTKTKNKPYLAAPATREPVEPVLLFGGFSTHIIVGPPTKLVGPDIYVMSYRAKETS